MRAASVGKNQPAGMDEDSFESSVWEIWTEAHGRVGPLRQEAYKIMGHLNQKTDTEAEKAELTRFYEAKLIPHPDDAEKLSHFAQEGVTCARAFEEETERISKATPKDVLRITTRAGIMLYYTEQILLRYDGLKAQATAAKTSLPVNLGGILLSAAMTVAATGRDQIDAADGHVKNLQEQIGSKERRYLGGMLAVTVIVYLALHPSLDSIIPLQYRVYWEIVFWSLFGAMSVSFININEDVMNGNFDPRHLYKYEYRIAVSPLVALVLVLFLTLVGVSSGSVALKLDLADPNIPVIVLLSFLFGFFGKKSLDLLDSAWQRLFPDAAPAEAQGKTSPQTGQPSTAA